MGDGDVSGTPPLHRHILLVGLPGAGKTSVGRRLAKDLGRPFADTDEQIELHVGRSIPRIFAEEGEPAFRRWETEVLGLLLGRESPLVVASGGGTVVRPDNQDLVAERSIVVWLRAGPEFLAARTDATHRPLLATDPRGTYERLYAERAAIYARLADLVIDVEDFQAATGGKPKHAISRHIVELLGGSPRAPEPAEGG